MKISDIHQQPNANQYVNQTNSSNQPDSHQASREVRNQSSSQDKVELSTQSREMQKAFEVLQASPDVRNEKVTTLKKLIQEGRYQVDNEALAGKMIKESLLELIK